MATKAHTLVGFIREFAEKSYPLVPFSSFKEFARVVSPVRGSKSLKVEALQKFVGTRKLSKLVKNNTYWQYDLLNALENRKNS